MSKLIYHGVGEPENAVSQLDETIMEMVASKGVKLAYPYIGREPLERLLSQCTTWQLLTDLGELLPNMGIADRKWFVEFLTENGSRIRHIKDLHAKVLVAGQQGLVGSANLTMKGLTKRTEMSVLLSDHETVDELVAWFDKLWNCCSPIDPRIVAEFVSDLPARSLADDYSATLSLPFGPQINSKLKPMQKRVAKTSNTKMVPKKEGKKASQSTYAMLNATNYDIAVPTATIDVNGKVIRGKDKIVPMPLKKVLILALLQQNAGRAIIKDGAGGLTEMLEDVLPSGEKNVQENINDFCRELADDGLATFGRKKYPIQEMPLPPEERRRLIDLLDERPRRGEKRTITSLGQLVKLPAPINDFLTKGRI